MMMKMLEAGGISPLTDEVREPDPDNPKGYYEFERVKQLEKGDAEWLGEARGKVVKVISALLKHLPDEYRYRVIFMRRDMEEILASQRKMLERRGKASNGVDDQTMAEHFERHLTEVQQWLNTQPNVEVLYIHYRALLEDPHSQAAQINTFLGGGLKTAPMAEVVDPDLYRNRAQAA